MAECYICDEQDVSLEHIPPLCLFPESKDLPAGLDLRKNLITVPACAEHNLRKSGDDEYLLFILVANINVNFAGLNQWRTKIDRAMKYRPSKRRIFKNLQPVQYHGVRTGKYEIDFERISRQFVLIARGIYYYHFRKHWSHALELAIPFAIPGSEQTRPYSQAMTKLANLATQFLRDEPKLGDNPGIFSYQYKLITDSQGLVLRMVFYGGIEVVAFFGGNNAQSIQVA